MTTWKIQICYKQNEVNTRFHSFKCACAKHQWYINFNTAYWIAGKNKPFLSISILKFSFLPSSMFALLFENMLPKSNAYTNFRIIASFFWIGNIFLVLLRTTVTRNGLSCDYVSTYLENTERDIILCVKMSFLRNKLHVLILMIVVKNWNVNLRKINDK